MSIAEQVYGTERYSLFSEVLQAASTPYSHFHAPLQFVYLPNIYHTTKLIALQRFRWIARYKYSFR